MSKSSLPKWNDETTAALVEATNNFEVVSLSTVDTLASQFNTTARSVASKLRKLGKAVEAKAQAVSTFTEDDTNTLRSYVEANPGRYTVAEITAAVFGESRTARSVQGKLLSMDLLGSVKKTEKPVASKSYTEEEEATIESLVTSGAFIEDVAAALGRSVQSIRGKILSMKLPIPKQKEYKSKTETNDGLSALGDVSNQTVEQIAEALGKTVRGVKTMLTHRGITAANYDGAARKAKAAAAKETKAE